MEHVLVAEPVHCRGGLLDRRRARLGLAGVGVGRREDLARLRVEARVAIDDEHGGLLQVLVAALWLPESAAPNEV